MKKTIKTISLRFLVLALGVGSLYSCTVDPDSPGLEYMPDMARTPSIQPYVDYGWVREKTNPALVLTKSAKHPPIHTIAYHGDIDDLEIFLPYHRKANSFASKTHGLLPEDGWELSDQPGGDYFASAEDKNPIKLTAENEEEIFKHGKELFTINCAHCHGKKGDGKGPMVESGAYLGVPDYHNLLALSDGQMFFSIYYGKGMMGAHAPLLNNYEIWTLVHYINKLRFEGYDANYGTAEASDSTDVAVTDEENVDSEANAEETEEN